MRIPLPDLYGSVLVGLFACLWAFTFAEHLIAAEDGALYYVVGKALYLGEEYVSITPMATPVNSPPLGYPGSHRHDHGPLVVEHDRHPDGQRRLSRDHVGATACLGQQEFLARRFPLVGIDQLLDKILWGRTAPPTHRTTQQHSNRQSFPRSDMLGRCGQVHGTTIAPRRHAGEHDLRHVACRPGIGQI